MNTNETPADAGGQPEGDTAPQTELVVGDGGLVVFYRVVS